jgi:hypothetical protein
MHLIFGAVMPKRTSHHGENIHKMEQVPENPSSKGQLKSEDLLVGSRGNLPPTEIKRLTHPKSQQQVKKTSNETQT